MTRKSLRRNEKRQRLTAFSEGGDARDLGGELETATGCERPRTAPVANAVRVMPNAGACEALMVRGNLGASAPMAPYWG